jgi:hypothetical protein
VRIALLLAGVALLVYLIVDLGPREIFTLLARIGWGFAGIAAVYALHQAVRARALSLAVAVPGAVRLRDAFFIRLSGEAVQFLTSTGPFLSEPSKALMLGRRGLSKTEGFAATIAEYLAYMFVSATILTAASWYLTSRGDLPPAIQTTARVVLIATTVFLLVSAVAIVRRIYLIGGVVRGLGRLPGVGRRLSVEPGAVRRMEDLLFGVLRDRPGRFAHILTLEAIAQVLMAAELWWILKMTGIATGLGTAFVLDAANKFTGFAFFFVPGQIGAAEGVNVVMFQALGFSSVAGITVALARRIRSALTAGAGLLVLTIMTRK